MKQYDPSRYALVSHDELRIAQAERDQLISTPRVADALCRAEYDLQCVIAERDRYRAALQVLAKGNRSPGVLKIARDALAEQPLASTVIERGTPGNETEFKECNHDWKHSNTTPTGFRCCRCAMDKDGNF